MFLFSFEPKNKRNYFLISALSALASNNGLNQKMEALYYIQHNRYLYFLI